VSFDGIRSPPLLGGGAGEEGAVFSGVGKWCVNVFDADVLVGTGFVAHAAVGCGVMGSSCGQVLSVYGSRIYICNYVSFRHFLAICVGRSWSGLY
jgi:hypothetical protein